MTTAFVKGLASILGKWAPAGAQGKTQRQSPVATERMRFERDVREQLIKLKEKGINLPVFTL
jgi:hypothetical protein